MAIEPYLGGFVNPYDREEENVQSAFSPEYTLRKTIASQERELELRNKPKKKESKGIVPRILDVISRPLYGAANVVKSDIETVVPRLAFAARDVAHGEFGDALGEVSNAFKDRTEALSRGVSGKDKTTYGQILEDDFGFDSQSGFDKTVRGLGGFVLDVAGDPSTYATFGTSTALEGGLKAGTESLAKTAAGNAAKSVLEKGSKSVSKRVSEKLLDDFVAKGLGEQADTLIGTGLKDFESRALQDEALEAGLRAQDKILKSADRKFGLKLGDTQVLGSRKLYNIGSKLNEAFEATNIGSGLKKTFSTGYKLPGQISTFRSEARGYSHAQFEDLTKSVRSQFKGLSKEDKRLISDAIEQGKDLSGIRGVSGVDLGSYQQAAMDYLDSIKQVEIGRGILDEKDLLDNYVYHHYQTTDRDAVNAFKKTRKKSQNPNIGASAKINPNQQTLFPKSSTVKSLEEAEKLGLKPIREIDDIILLRGAKSYNEQAGWGLADAVKREFGVKLGDKEAKVAEKLDLIPSSSKYLKNQNVYFPREVENGLKKIESLRFNPEEANGLLRLYDKGLANFKFLATAANPGHHIRNMAGDVFLNSLDGVTNPIRYAQAAKVLGDSTGKSVIRIGDGVLSSEEIRNLYKLKGAKAGYTRVEIGARRLAPAEKIRELAEAREDFTRMAHFIDALKKEGAHIKNPQHIVERASLEKAASKAAQRVRKFNIDYGDLTEVEKKVFKRVAPFYTWMRKNVPLQLETLALAPGRQAIVPKALTAMRQLAGDNGEYPSIGGLDTVPKWIRDMAGVRIVGEGEGRNGVYFDPSVIIPSMDALRQVGEPLDKVLHGDVSGAVSSVTKEILNQTNPAIQGVVEFGTGQDVFTGGQLRDTGLGGYAQNTIPASRIISDVLTGRSSKWKNINYLTGASFREVTPQSTMSELRRQQDLIEGQLRISGGTRLDLVRQERKILNEKRKNDVRNQLLTYVNENNRSFYGQ